MAWTASRRTVALIAAIGVLLPSLAILQLPAMKAAQRVAAEPAL